MADNNGGGNYALVGGRAEGTPLTVNLMKPVPGLTQPTLDQALIVGAHTGAVNVQGVEGYDFRNFRRSNRFMQNKGIVR